MTTHPFEIDGEIEVTATPEQVWEAIATGPGVDAWFWGSRATIEPGVGGRASFEMGGEVANATVTAWEPGTRFAYRGDASPDGSFMAFEYLVEARDGGSTVVRFVQNGLLAGDDWESQYDAMREGGPMYGCKLAAYVTHFAGRPLRQHVVLVGPQVAEDDRVWAAFTDAMGVTGSITEGDPVRLTLGDERIEGTVDYVRPGAWAGVRSADGIYSLMHGYQSVVVLEYSGFSEERDEKKIESAMRSWLDTTFV
jgi:uncharacterized protein YndB with AHSA1/START domain